MDTKVIFLWASITRTCPASYVRPESERPRLSEVSNVRRCSGCQDRNQNCPTVGDACEHYGFFQVINHGVSLEAVEKMLGLAVLMVNKEKVHNWRDYLRLHCYPLDKYVPEWPSNPPPFKTDRSCDPSTIDWPCDEVELEDCPRGRDNHIVSQSNSVDAWHLDRASDVAEVKQ
ncbi:hypothetical protein NC652_034202 [Populus alba x Populus x berolinensis]|nr:hypothetical protein NC652_034202 [Populus alba x Populus x berolinensis]